MGSNVRQISKERRLKLRNQLWADAAEWDLWGKEVEVGFFQAPRILPLLFTLLAKKEISGKSNPAAVYLDLFSRHFGDGFIEMSSSDEHSFALGYLRKRTWEDGMKLLEDLGFIVTKPRGNGNTDTFVC